MAAVAAMRSCIAISSNAKGVSRSTANTPRKPRLGRSLAPARFCAPRQRCRRLSAAEVKSVGTVVASKVVLKSAACNLPHPEKVATGGEDAWFVSSAGAGSIGVADGVGGWRESGIDAGDYSKVFMKEAKKYIEAGDPVPVAAASSSSSEDEEEAVAEPQPPAPKMDPVGALRAGHDNTRLPGSCTAVVLQLNGETSKIQAANLGDSGFVVYRNGRVLHQSEPLQHYFDCPFQFGAYPEYVEMTDTPSDAQEFNLTVKPGDVIIMGSDGLWDNCYQEEVGRMILQEGDDLEKLSKRIADSARNHAGDAEFESPYTNSAIEEGLDLPWWEKVAATKIKDGKVIPGRLTGGKMDDITVVVAAVVAT